VEQFFAVLQKRDGVISGEIPREKYSPLLLVFIRTCASFLARKLDDTSGDWFSFKILAHAFTVPWSGQAGVVNNAVASANSIRTATFASFWPRTEPDYIFNFPRLFGSKEILKKTKFQSSSLDKLA